MGSAPSRKKGEQKKHKAAVRVGHHFVGVEQLQKSGDGRTATDCFATGFGF